MKSQAMERNTFIHPYNFVSLPQDGLGEAGGVVPFKRGSPAPHDRYDPECFSGHLDCLLTTRAPWFIPDPRKRSTDERTQHTTLGYFTLDAVDRWDAQNPQQDSTAPALPAASLRGMVRSVFEAATLSCLSIFDGGRLDFRIGFDPATPPRGLPPARSRVPSYVPVRALERRSTGTAVVQQLIGRLRQDEERPVVLPVALVHAYTPRVRVNDRAGNATALWSSLNLPDGAEVAAVIRRSPVTHRSGRFRYREARTVVPADQAQSLRVGSDEWLIFGYLHRTGPNIENKHRERIFFRADAPYNNPDASTPVAQRLLAFRADREPCLVVSADVVLAAEESLAEYAERHERALKAAPVAPRPITPGAPHPSDFVGKRRFEEGDLCYALVEDGSRVRGLYPVALPRLAHEHSRADLLHKHFYPCEDHERLCAACRVFGWVRPGERRKPEPGRVDAWGGHVRFTHGIVRGEWSESQRKEVAAIPLAVLSSPKPTTTAFYLKPREDFDRARAARWPPILQTAFAGAIPLYRKDEAVLRGRKMYRRRERVDTTSDDPRRGGIVRPLDPRTGSRVDDQNQTIHLLPAGLRFGFRVFFDNLTREELGTLVFALELQIPSVWNADGYKLCHSIGHGKPLGFGACSIEIEDMVLDRIDPSNPQNRYAQVPEFQNIRSVKEAPGQPLSAEKRQTLSEFVDAFAEAWLEGERCHPTLRTVRFELLEMLRADPPPGPIHYPPDPDGGTGDNFRWFVENRHPSRGLGILLPDPVAERRNEQARLPVDPRSGRSRNTRR